MYLCCVGTHGRTKHPLAQWSPARNDDDSNVQY